MNWKIGAFVYLLCGSVNENKTTNNDSTKLDLCILIHSKDYLKNVKVIDPRRATEKSKIFKKKKSDVRHHVIYI